MRNINWLKLIFSILGCLLAGAVGSLFTTPAIDTWYSSLIKPSFNPPNWIFGPVWTALFILMGVAFYLIWQRESVTKEKQVSLIIFVVQLILNILWSFFFFYLHQPLLAFSEIILLWLFILLTILYFSKMSKLAAYLLIPYILWVSFASILNLTIYYLNK